MSDFFGLFGWRKGFFAVFPPIDEQVDRSEDEQGDYQKGVWAAKVGRY